MRTRYYVAASLDGFLATEDDSVAWLYTLGDDNRSTYPAFIAEIGAIVMGAATYEWIHGHAEEAIAEVGAAWPYTQPTWVFTHRALTPIAGADVRFVSGDVGAVHAAIRAAVGDRDLWIAGGGELAAQFHDAGLLDEVIVSVASLTLGRGKPLFPRRLPTPWILEEVTMLGTGFAELRYRVPERAP
ncbi:MAG: dihydrofolate reductase family protein [Gemmatimonadaceae bacterium]